MLKTLSLTSRRICFPSRFLEDDITSIHIYPNAKDIEISHPDLQDVECERSHNFKDKRPDINHGYPTSEVARLMLLQPTPSIH